MNNFDLQIQTTASDGKNTPREAVEMAHARGVEVIAITDHDTVGGVEEAIFSGSELGVQVIPGIEMSVEEHGTHILGYGIDYKNEALLKKLEELKQARIEGAKQMVENLKKAGFRVEWPDVLQEATGGVVARPHIARAILKRGENKQKLGGVSTVHDFIQTYLSNESLSYVKRKHISAQDAIALIRSTGGVAVWSHPAIHFRNDYEKLEQFLEKLRGWGIRGLEVFNPSHTEDDVEFLESLAVKYGLLRTAGSDFHEEGPHHRDPGSGLHSAEMIGEYETYGFLTNNIISELHEAIEKRRLLAV